MGNNGEFMPFELTKEGWGPFHKRSFFLAIWVLEIEPHNGNRAKSGKVLDTNGVFLKSGFTIKTLLKQVFKR